MNYPLKLIPTILSITIGILVRLMTQSLHVIADIATDAHENIQITLSKWSGFPFMMDADH